MKTAANISSNDHIAEYERWFDRYPDAFEMELEAIRRLLPHGEDLDGLEIGVCTGRFARALKIRHGIEPAENMRELALQRGIRAIDGVAENLPYRGLSFDFVLMNYCTSYLSDVEGAFTETWRVLKYGGCLIVGFLEEDGPIARPGNVTEMQELLTRAGYKNIEFTHTLFTEPGPVHPTARSISGYGRGSYILAKAIKQSD